MTASAASTSITLTIYRPTGGITDYHIFCVPASGGAPVFDRKLFPTLGEQTALVESLVPYTEYACTITSDFLGKTNSFTITIFTLQAGKLLYFDHKYMSLDLTIGSFRLIKSKLRYQKEMSVLNITWKFEDIIFLNSKNMNI